MEYAQIRSMIRQKLIQSKIYALSIVVFSAGIAVISHLILHKYIAEFGWFFILILQMLRFIGMALCIVFAGEAAFVSSKSEKDKLDELQKNGTSAEEALEELGLAPKKK